MTTSLAKGLAVLNALERAGQPRSLRRLASETGLPKSTIHRLVGELRAAGLVETSSEGDHLGLRLFELGGAALRQNHIATRARPYLEELYERTHHLTQLGVLRGTDVMYVVRVGRQGHQLVASPLGGRMPASCTAVGKAILAFDDEALEHALLAGLARRTRYSITDPDLLRATLAETRRTRVATELEEARVSLACVASPVIVDGQVRAAVSVTMPARQLDPPLHAPLVRAAATALSHSLSATRSGALASALTTASEKLT